MTDLINSGSGNSSSAGDNPLRNSPFGRLSEVLSDEELSNLFSGVGNGENSGNPLGGGGGNLPYNGNPFAGDNFWNIFAGGVNPSAGGGGRDPLIGAGSQSTNISTTEIPDGFNLRVTIDNLINSRLNEELGDDEIPSFDPSQIPSFGGGNGGGQIPSFGGGNGGQIPSFDPSQIPSFGGGNGGGQIPSFGGGNGGGQIPFA